MTMPGVAPLARVRRGRAVEVVHVLAKVADRPVRCLGEVVQRDLDELPVLEVALLEDERRHARDHLRRREEAYLEPPLDALLVAGEDAAQAGREREERVVDHNRELTPCHRVADRDREPSLGDRVHLLVTAALAAGELEASGESEGRQREPSKGHGSPRSFQCGSGHHS
jgi:hypothetical protein